jgi:hypothetical protein
MTNWPDIPLTHEQYSALINHLRAIASGRKQTRTGVQRMTREEIINEGREACDAINLDWSHTPPPKSQP